MSGEAVGGDSTFHAACYDELLRLARNSIAEFLSTGQYLPSSSEDPWLMTPAAVFVTLRIQPDSGREDEEAELEAQGELRGCIGQVEPQMPLYLAVQDAAIKAAVNDPRFYPVKPDELDSLLIKVSILTEMRPVESLDEVVIGRDGLLIVGDRRRGLLLPEVAVTYGWSCEEYLYFLCQKAGLPADAWPRRARLFAFGVESFEEH
jgi:AmmeMemoRadiSam system protein A